MQVDDTSADRGPFSLDEKLRGLQLCTSRATLAPFSISLGFDTRITATFVAIKLPQVKLSDQGRVAEENRPFRYMVAKFTKPQGLFERLGGQPYVTACTLHVVHICTHTHVHLGHNDCPRDVYAQEPLETHMTNQHR